MNERTGNSAMSEFRSNVMINVLGDGNRRRMIRQRLFRQNVSSVINWPPVA